MYYVSVLCGCSTCVCVVCMYFVDVGTCVCVCVCACAYTCQPGDIQWCHTHFFVDLLGDERHVQVHK